MKENKITVLHEATALEPFIIINKPSGLPSAPLYEGDESALTQTLSLYPSIMGVRGKKAIEYGLLHRLDTETEGLLLIAGTQDFYDYMKETQDRGLFVKQYRAVCFRAKKAPDKDIGYPDSIYAPKISDKTFPCSISSMFRPYGSNNCEVRPVCNGSSIKARKKATKFTYTTQILSVTPVKNTLSSSNETVEVIAQLERGFRHQVRSHLSWASLPIVSDPIYDYENCKKDAPFDFKAIGLSFPLQNGRIFNFKLNYREPLKTQFLEIPIFLTDNIVNGE